MKIIVDGLLPSLNKIQRMHWSVRNKQNQQWKETVYWLAKQAKATPLKEAVLRFTYYFPDRRKRDYDNYNSKWLIDGLKGIAIEDDNYTCVKSISTSFEYDKNKPRIEIEIMEVS